MEYVEDNFEYLNDFLEKFNRKGFKENRYFFGKMIFKTELRDLENNQIIAPVLC